MSVSTFLIVLLGLAGLIITNGLFVAAEYALVSIRKSRVDEMAQQGGHSARTVHWLKSRIDRSIAGSQLGITIASLTIGWIGGEIAPVIAKFAVEQAPASLAISVGPIAFALAFVTLSLTQVVLGEQIPKQIALRLPEQTIVRLSAPFRVFCVVMSPFIWLMSVTAAAALKLLGISDIHAGEHHLPSPDEFQILFEESERAGTLGKQESDLLRRALELKATTVREVMIPRTRMDTIAETLTLQEVIAVVTRTKHSKLPVYRGGRDNVIGILNTRDLFDVWGSQVKTPPAVQQQQPFKLNALVRRAYFVPETMPASSLLEEMRARQLQMAMVIDEFGATVGLITLEDLIEQLVGDIWDEYDKPNPAIEAFGLGMWKVHGDLTLFEFNKAFAANLTSGHSTTIAGVVIETLGHQAAVDETVIVAGFEFVVLELTGHAIAKLQVTRLPPSSEEAAISPNRKPDGEQH